MDLTNPNERSGRAGDEFQSRAERGSPDLVMALAYMHHLTISNYVALGRIAQYCSRLAPRLIVECVPKEDAQIQRALGGQEDIFDRYRRVEFPTNFGEHCRVLATQQVVDSGRWLYLIERRA
jgi:hypothetical protein